MGLLDKLVDKMVEPTEIDFKNFIKYYDSNNKKAKKYEKDFHNDMKRILKFPQLHDYADEFVLKKWCQNRDDLFNETKSKTYSKQIANIMKYAKMYAIYFMYTDAGRLEKQKLAIENKLSNLYTLTIFNTISHFLSTRGETLTWVWAEERKDGGKFVGTITEDGVKLLNLIVENMNNIAIIANGIKEDDTQKVFQAYENINNCNISSIISEEIFEL